MNEHTYKTLEFDLIKEALVSFTVSGLGRRLVETLSPATDYRAVEQRINETTETRNILEAAGHIPLHGLSDITEAIERAERGSVLDPHTLLHIADFLRGCRKIKVFMAKYSQIAPMVSGYANGIAEFEELEDEIELSVENGRVTDAASSRLAKIRTRIEIVGSRIKQKMNSYLTSSKYQDYLQEFIVSLKDGRYCLAVKASCRHQMDGTVVSSSGSGQTVFIEPTVIRALANEQAVLRGEEEAEEYQVLAGLTGEITARAAAIKHNIEIMAVYDFACAKAKYSRTINGVAPELEKKTRLVIREGRHPGLGKQAVPLDFFIGCDFRTLLITGPNTGGKTVALKTIGLFILMTKCGLHVPAAKGTIIGDFDKVLVDIGDRQSIEQSLSTFSGHMRNIIDIQSEAGKKTLTLLDEIGTGTDPAEGSALAAAVLEDLYEAGGITVATTHYGDLKAFSQNHEGFCNGSMEFNPETLQPLYRLQIGKSGQSNGIWIAERLGMRPSTLAKARVILGQGLDSDTYYSVEEEKEVNMPVYQPPVYVPVEPKLKMETDENLSNRPFRVGDSVYVGTIKENAILCELADKHGDVTVLYREKRLKVNQKRIKLHIPAEQLYPDIDNYDLDTVLLSWEDRKLKKAMNKRHVPNKERVIDP
jgi:DNA mismatch repair protein MutS2